MAASHTSPACFVCKLNNCTGTSAETMHPSLEKPTFCLHPGSRTPVWDSTGHRHPRGSGLIRGIMARWAYRPWTENWNHNLKVGARSLGSPPPSDNNNPFLPHSNTRCLIEMGMKCVPLCLVAFHVALIITAHHPSSSVCSILILWCAIQPECQWK